MNPRSITFTLRQLVIVLAVSFYEKYFFFWILGDTFLGHPVNIIYQNYFENFSIDRLIWFLSNQSKFTKSCFYFIVDICETITWV